MDMLTAFELGVQYTLQPGLTSTTLRKRDFVPIEDTQGVGNAMSKRGIGVHIADDASYHPAFHLMHFQPFVLYTMGNVDALTHKCLGVVGPRYPSLYAQEVLQAFLQETLSYRLAIVSGGAKGIDMQAHLFALKHIIPTIVVVGGGLLYYLNDTRMWEFLQRVISAGGLIISPFKLYQTPQQWTFPARNKLIAGVAQMLFVPAAGTGSGSLITVDFAHEMGTPVYAVPASIYEVTSYGTNTYIAQGKILPIIDFAGVLASHFPLQVETSSKASLGDVHTYTPDEMRVLEQLANGPQGLMELTEALHLPIEEILSVLTGLEMQGQVREYSSRQYKRL